MSMEIPENLYDLVDETTNHAVGLVASKPEQKKIVQEGQNYLISYIETLQNKDEKTKKQKTNPFENPEKSMVVLRDEKYTLVLNKFPVIRNHFLLITNEFVKQDTLLTPNDLRTMLNVLLALEKSKSGTPLAFFNSGPASGASQAHKHVQFIQCDTSDFELFPDNVVGNQKVFFPDPDHPTLKDPKKQFAHFIMPLKTEDGSPIDDDTLAMVYMALVQNCLTVVKDYHISTTLESPESHSLSYNLLMTSKWLMLVPRSKDFVTCDNYTFGTNSLGFIGMLLVKHKEAFEKLTNGSFTIEENILAKAGFASKYEKPDSEGDY